MTGADPGEDPRLRFRVWVDAQLVEETWTDAGNPDILQAADRMRARHLALTDAADAAGQQWLVEVFDPAKPAEQAYLRFGTDRAGMVRPRRWRASDDDAEEKPDEDGE